MQKSNRGKFSILFKLKQNKSHYFKNLVLVDRPEQPLGNKISFHKPWITTIAFAVTRGA